MIKNIPYMKEILETYLEEFLFEKASETTKRRVEYRISKWMKIFERRGWIPTNVVYDYNVDMVIPNNSTAYIDVKIYIDKNEIFNIKVG